MSTFIGGEVYNMKDVPIEILTEQILDGHKITFEEAEQLFSVCDRGGVMRLLAGANRIRDRFVGNSVDLCSILNAKSGMCFEDCAFCAQSRQYNTGCKSYPLVSVSEMVSAAEKAHSIGANEFCIVTSGCTISNAELELICHAVREIKENVGIDVDCSLGRLERAQAGMLKEVGIRRYNHNIETARTFFGNICTTHAFDDRLRTVNIIKEGGIENCCGGVIGMGESKRCRIEMALMLRELGVSCVPINILNPRKGTPLEKVPPLPPLEILTTIAIFRMILPGATIKVAGGREVNLRDLQSLALLAGVNGMIIGGYLTTSGREPERDIQMIRDLGFDIGAGHPRAG
jgi:biotin synthase